MTPTQQRLLQRLGSGEQQVGQTDQVPSINRPRAKVPQLERVESIEETRVQQADSMSSAPVTKSVGPGPETNTMSLFDAMEKRYFAPSAVTEGKPAAEEFCSPPAHYG